MVWKAQKMAQYCREMAQNCPIWFKIVQNGPRWSKMIWNGPIWFWNGPRWPEMVQDGLKRYKMVQDSKKVHDALSIGSNTFWIHKAFAPSVLKKQTPDQWPPSPFLWFNLFRCHFSFLFVQIFLYSQVDRLFQMGHCAIYPCWWSCLQKKQTFPHATHFRLCNTFAQGMRLGTIYSACNCLFVSRNCLLTSQVRVTTINWIGQKGHLQFIVSLGHYFTPVTMLCLDSDIRYESQVSL